MVREEQSGFRIQVEKGSRTVCNIKAEMLSDNGEVDLNLFHPLVLSCWSTFWPVRRFPCS
jgi:hypothetical protein